VLVTASLVLSSVCLPQATSGTQEERVFRAPFKGGGWPVLSASSYPEGALPFSRFVREGGGFDFLSEGAGQETDVTRFHPRHFSTEKIPVL
jgi:hypothetical protein